MAIVRHVHIYSGLKDGLKNNTDLLSSNNAIENKEEKKRIYFYFLKTYLGYILIF
jgi:hypothetical protein